MPVSIGDLTFTKTPIWENLKSTEDLVTARHVAIDGTVMIREGSPPAEYSIILVARDNTGWIRGSEIDALKAMARVPMATYTLNYQGAGFTVRFENERSGGAIQMTQHKSLETSNPGPDTWYTGTLYLMAVA
jgi:hypothetical protein